jgi:hypothetical protein
MSDVAQSIAPSTRTDQSMTKMLIVWFILAFVAGVIGMRLPQDPSVSPPNDKNPQVVPTKSE